MLADERGNDAVYDCYGNLQETLKSSSSFERPNSYHYGTGTF